MFPFKIARWSLVLLLTASIVPILSGCGKAPAEAVASYEPFEASDKSFSGQGPAGWDKEASDLGGTVGKVTFTKGDAAIRIVSDTASSFLADAIKIPNGPPPVEAIHQKGLAKLEELFSNPEAGASQELTSAVGPARFCEFTADGGKTRGYRSTALGNRVIYVTASCPESDWETLKPAFSKVIGSIANGSGP